MAQVEEKKISIDITTLSIIRVLTIVTLLWFVREIKEVILIFFLALLLSSVLEPMIRWFISKRVPKMLAAVMVYLIMMGIVGVVLSLMVTPINTQFRELGTQMPIYIDKISSGDVFGLQNLAGNEQLFNRITMELQGLQSRIVNATTTGFFSSITSIIGTIAGFVVIIVMSFYLIVEEESIKKTVKMLVPAHYQPYLVQLFKKIQNKIGYWARAYLMMAAIVWFMAFVLLTALQVPFALVLSLVAAFTEIIPMVGPILAAIPAVFVAVFASPIKALFVAIGFTIINLIESHVLTPKIMQKAVGLNPVIVILAVLIGARLGGILGILLAIPVTTTLSVFIADFFPERE